ncbi:MAG: ATP-binding protein [candidate division Zixibacteria bacterium]|nr:ATP-binding protein [candidate division Zixibacteria bacterium]
MAGTVTWTYPSVKESGDRFLDDLALFLEPLGLEQHQFHYLTLSLSEAFTNALVHGNKLDETKLVTVRLTVNDLEISADIIDQGRGGLEAVRTRPRPELLAESGRGVDFMERYCASVEFMEDADGGLTVRLRVPRRHEKKRVQ